MKRITMVDFRRNARRWLEAVRKGERLLLTYRGEAVARIEPVPSQASGVGEEDALLNIDEFAVDGAGGPLGNDEIDRLVYGS